MVKVEEESLLETDEDESSEVLCGDCGAYLRKDHDFDPKSSVRRPFWRSIPTKRNACGCCGCCACFGLLLLAVAVGLGFYLNSILQVGVQLVGSNLLGVDVSLDEVNVGLIRGRATITNLNVASPEGYNDDLFDLHRFIFDVAPSSLFDAWATSFTKPVVIEDLSVYDCAVGIENKLFSKENNAAQVISHIDQVTRRISPQVEQEVMHPTPPPVQTGIKAMEVKITVDRLVIRNISVTASLPPIPAIRYTLKEVRVENVGKKHGGVYLYEFMEIFVRALLMSVVKGAPDSVQVNLASAFGEDLWRELDISGVLFDAGGGLEQLGEFAGWVSAEAALMPVKLAASSAEMGAKAVGLGVKMNEEAMKIGAELTGEAAKAHMKAINEEVKIGAKATEEAAKIGLAFESGMAKAFTR